MSNKYINVENIDVERISCYYGGNCRIEDVEEWLNEIPIEEDLEKVVRCAKCVFSEDHQSGDCICLKTHTLHSGTYYCADGKEDSFQLIELSDKDFGKKLFYNENKTIKYLEETHGKKN